MGWMREGFDKHEGYLIGYVERKDGRRKLSDLWRELQYPSDDKPIARLPMVSAGCDCGWRSARWFPMVTASWHPFSVTASERDEENARGEWDRHLSGLRPDERNYERH